MSIAGVGGHTGYYYGMGMHKQVTESEESFGKCLYDEGSEVLYGGERHSSRIDSRELYEAMSKGVQFTELHGSGQPEEVTGAVTIAEKEDEGEFLGLTMVPEEGQSVTYGMRAMLSEKSTPDNPIVQVVSNLGGEKKIYNVEVNKVDPDNATQLEMFALLSYTDKKGITDGGSFGSFHQLKVYGSNASMKGYCGSLSGGDVFINEPFEWPVLIEKMMKDYFEAEIYKQSEDCQALLDFFAKYEPEEDGVEQISEGVVIEKSIVSLPSGISFYMSEDTGEVACIDDSNNLPGRQCLWSKFLSEEDFERCMELFEREKGETDWEYKYEAYLAHESFWDMYLNGEICFL